MVNSVQPEKNKMERTVHPESWLRGSKGIGRPKMANC